MSPWQCLFESSAAKLFRGMKRHAIGVRATMLAFAMVAVAMIGASTVHAATYPAASPELAECHPRGLQIGGTTRMTLRGQHLSGARLLLPIAQALKVSIVQASDQELTCDITVDAQVAPGHYPLRVAHADGVSTALTIGLDRLQQIDFSPTLDHLPVALHGTIAGDQRLVTQFAGTEHQVLVLDLEGRRLGSSIRPVVRLFGPDERQLAISRPQVTILGDTRMSVTLPASGNYRLELHDAVYQGPAPGWFRLKIGASIAYADRIYPIAASSGQMQTVEYLGSNLTATRALQSPFSEPGVTRQLVPWPESSGTYFTGPQPGMLAGDPLVTEFTEESYLAARPQSPLALGVCGRVSRPGEADHFVIPVKPGERMRVELQAASFGSALDGVLDVFSGATAPPATAQGNLGHADDQPGSADPAIEFQVPDNEPAITVRVSSLLPSGGAEHDYRLVAKSITARPPRLILDAPRVIIPSGSTVVTPVRIEPQEPRGSWRLSLNGDLASLVTVNAADIEPDDVLSLVEWQAAPLSHGVVFARLVASPASGERSPASAVTANAFPGSSVHPDWLTRLPIAITREAPLVLQWAENSLPAEWLRGAHQTLRLEWTRPADGHAGPLRLSLMTNQVPPTKSENNATVPDLARTWRMQELSAIRGDQPGSEISVICPPDLPLRNGSLAVKAELLSDDGATVLSTVFSPVIRRPVVDALQLQAALPSKVEVVAGDEAGLVLEGTLARHASATFPVEIGLEGLPSEVTIAPVRVEVADQQWKILVRLPAEAMPRELKDLRVTAKFIEAGQAWADVVVRSGPFVMEVKPAKPAGT